jgi:hypothetical protein
VEDDREANARQVAYVVSLFKKGVSLDVHCEQSVGVVSMQRIGANGDGVSKEVGR